MSYIYKYVLYFFWNTRNTIFNKRRKLGCIYNHIELSSNNGLIENRIRGFKMCCIQFSENQGYSVYGSICIINICEWQIFL